MSAEENKALIRRWVELWNTQNVAAVGELVVPTYVRHDPNSPEVRGVEGEQQFMTMAIAAFPDLKFTTDDLFGEGDRVAGHYTLRGTHQGEWLGIPPTNQGHRI